MNTPSEHVFQSNSHQSAFVEPVKMDRPASPYWPRKRAKKHDWKVTDGIKHPVTVRFVASKKEN